MQATKVNTVVIFVDIRGFTKWSESTEVSESIGEFVSEFNTIVKKFFPQGFRKSLGDGCMLVRELDEKSIKAAKLLAVIEDIYDTIVGATAEFAKYSKQFSQEIGHPANLKLGWGVTRGIVTKVKVGNDVDYIGENINKCARLCSEARPYGIIIDKADFDVLPPRLGGDFFVQLRKFVDFSDAIECWVTKEIKTQFVPREKLKETPEVHVAGVCIRGSDKDAEIFIAKRSETRELGRGLYEGCGGQLRWGELFEEGVIRHYKKEMNLDVECLSHVHQFYSINSKSIIPGITFLCKYKGGEPTLANHTESKWVKVKEFKKMDPTSFIGSFHKNAVQLLKIYEKSKSQ